MNIKLIIALIVSSFIAITIYLYFNFQVSSIDEVAAVKLDKFFNCIEEKHSEINCSNENEEAYQALSKADVYDNEFANKQLSNREDCWSEESCEDLRFKKIAASCPATYGCETYSCLNKNLWRCHKE